MSSNEVLFHVDYSENYANLQQGEIQGDYFGHETFSISTTSAYLRVNGKAINEIKTECLAIRCPTSVQLMMQRGRLSTQIELRMEFCQSTCQPEHASMAPTISETLSMHKWSREFNGDVCFISSI